MEVCGKITLIYQATMNEQNITHSFTVIRDEFLVNTSTKSRQVSAEVAMASSGQFVIAWESRNSLEPDSFDTIFAKNFSATGEPLGDDFAINTTIDNYIYLSGLGIDESANFVVVWNGGGIHLRRFNSGGIAQSDEFTVGDSTFRNTSPDVAMAENGDFIVTWEAYPDNQYITSDIYAQQFDAGGGAKGDPFRVNATTGVSNQSPQIAIDEEGEFVITWESGNLNTGINVYARRFDTTGAELGDEIRVNDTISSDQQYHNDPSIAINGEGHFVISWETYNREEGEFIYAQLYDSAGTARGNNIEVKSGDFFYPDVAINNNEDFIVTYTFMPVDESGSDIYAKFYDATGEVKIQETLINTVTTGFQNLPVVAMNDDDLAIFAYNSSRDERFNDENDDNIFAKFYSLKQEADTENPNPENPNPENPNPENPDTEESDPDPDEYEPPFTENEIKGTKRDDVLKGTKKSDFIDGKKGNDTLTGKAGDDLIKGGNGQDVLMGSKGKDYLDGSKGIDVLNGGKGADVFQISKGIDLVEDFSIKQGDRIALDKKGKYSITDDPDGVLIMTSAKKQLFLDGVDYDDVIAAGIDLFVQPI